MSGIVLALAGGSFGPPPEPPPTVIGQAYGGGYYAGQIGVSSVATHYLVVGPIASAQSTLAWKNANTATAGADSDIDGPQNTADMVANGNATVYPAAHFCNDLVVGGKSDWYMPAKNELEICYYNLKPGIASNNTSSGINPNAVPARASNYTTSNPTRTSATDFQQGVGTEYFAFFFYWTSTEYPYAPINTSGRGQYFTSGLQTYTFKSSSYRVRAVRRVAV